MKRGERLRLRLKEGDLLRAGLRARGEREYLRTGERERIGEREKRLTGDLEREKRLTGDLEREKRLTGDLEREKRLTGDLEREKRLIGDLERETLRIGERRIGEKSLRLLISDRERLNERRRIGLLLRSRRIGA